jgi:hypothetical protein
MPRSTCATAMTGATVVVREDDMVSRLHIGHFGANSEYYTSTCPSLVHSNARPSWLGAVTFVAKYDRKRHWDVAMLYR